MRFFVHHTATSRDVSRDCIRQIHLARGFKDIGYTILIRLPVGQYIPEVLMGRPYDKDDEWEPWEYGAHAKGHNDSSMGIALVGNFEEEGLPWQMEFTLANVLALLCRQFGVAWDDFKDSIFGHNEVAATACPGKHVDMDAIRRDVYNLWLEM